MLARTIYNSLVLPGMRFGAEAASPFVRKIREGLAGRRELIARVQAFRRANPDARIALFHCASAGELEGIRPLARAIRERGFEVAISYFSPSARQAADKAREFLFADYSPVDRAGLVGAYYDALKPSLVLISKHDVWPNMVWKARERGIPAWLVNGNFHPRSLRTWPVAREFHRAIYESLSGILAVSESDANRARLIAGPATKVEAVGDSRFDRVIDRAERNHERFAKLREALAGRTVVVAGSTHNNDEHILFPALAECRVNSERLCAVVVPHDPSDEAVRRIHSLAEAYGLSIADTDGESAIETAADVLLINRTGILADLYAVGSLSFVGGAFDRGVHSVIEPMAHGLPVICGPNIAVSQEAREAQTLGLLTVIESSDQFCSSLQTLAENLCGLRAASREFVKNRAGAARNILRVILGAGA